MDKPQLGEDEAKNHGLSKDSRLSSASSDSSMIDGFYDFDEEVRSRNMEMLMTPRDSSNSLRYSTDSYRMSDFSSFKKEDELWVLDSLSMKMQSAEAVAEYYRRNPGVPRMQPSPSTVGGIDVPAPPVQTMDRNADPRNRIPAHVFATDPSSNPANWSVASNESLFSIHPGNMSFSKDQALLSQPEDIAINGKSRETEASVETMKAGLKENETKTDAAHHAADSTISNKSFTFSQESPEGEKGPSLKLEGSSSSKSSKGSKKSDSLKDLKPDTPEEKPEEQKEAVGETPLGGFSWFSCFPCCKGSPETENPPSDEAGKKTEAENPPLEEAGKKLEADKKPDDEVEGSKGKAGTESKKKGLNGKEEFSFS